MDLLLQQLLTGLASASGLFLVASGLTIIFGILGIAHFAHGSVAMFGGYLTFFLMSSVGL